MNTVQIREAHETDVTGILEIYNEVIAHTTAIYAELPLSLDDGLAWFRMRRTQQYPVLVAIDETGIAGVVSFGDFRAWPCYRHTVEHSVHVRADCRGRGIGSCLLDALIPLAGAADKHVLIAGIDADNVSSLKLHDRLGFKRVAHLREVGRKFDRWLDLVFVQRILQGQ